MAGQIPDPRALESWEDAFNHPIPVVSGMEKKLRSHIRENHEKLRTLVGASYRDLLGTARTIVDADAQMHRTEELLVDLGRKSDSRIVDKLSIHQARLSKDEASLQSPRLALASQLSLLQQCLHAIKRLLSNHQSLLLAAKLILVARNLYRTTAKDVDAPMLAKLGDRLAVLRQRLLRALDGRFEKIGSTPQELVDNMTAFSLVTSSSATDVVKHVQHLRLETLKVQDRGIMRGGKRLQAYLQTQQEIRAVFPDLLVASLKTVSARPLLQDPTITELGDLSLDIHLQWIASEVKTFTPYARYSDLQQTGSGSILEAWTDEALRSMLGNLRQDVESMTEVSVLMTLRHEIIQTWLSSKRYKSGTSARQVLDTLRGLFTERLRALSEQVFDGILRATIEPIHDALKSWDSMTKVASPIWDLSSASLDLNNAALSLRRELVNRQHGRTAKISDALGAFEAQWKAMNAFLEAIKNMKDTRWDDDDFDEDDDNDEVDDDTRISDLLAKTDPAKLRSVLSDGAGLFVNRLEEQLVSEQNDQLDCSDPSSPGLYLLRTIRELRQALPLFLENINRDASRRLICGPLVTNLQTNFIEAVVHEVEATLSPTYLKSTQRSDRLQTLWDGTPALPIQPSPGVFRMLRSLVKHMEKFGSDIWCPDSVTELHRGLNSSIATIIKSYLDEAAKNSEDHRTSLPEAKTNGIAHDDVDRKGQYERGEQDRVVSEAGMPSKEVDHQTNGIDTTSIADSATPLNPATGNSSVVMNKTVEYSSRSQPVSTLSVAAYTQLLFDVMYLSQALVTGGVSAAVSKSSAASLEALIPILVSRAEVQDVALLRLKKNAADYWRKTYLLFGLLSL